MLRTLAYSSLAMALLNSPSVASGYDYTDDEAISMTFRIAEAAASSSIIQVIDAYNAASWLQEHNTNFSTEVEVAVPNIVGRVLFTLPVNFTTCDEACLLSAMELASARSSLIAYQWAQLALNQTDPKHRHKHSVQQLDKVMSALAGDLTSNNRTLGVDMDDFDKEMESKHAYDDEDDKDFKEANHDDHDILAALIPAALTPSALINGFFSIDHCIPVAARDLDHLDMSLAARAACVDKVSSFFKRFLHSMKKMLPKVSKLRNLLRHSWSKDSSAIESGRDTLDQGVDEFSGPRTGTVRPMTEEQFNQLAQRLQDAALPPVRPMPGVAPPPEPVPPGVVPGPVSQLLRDPTRTIPQTIVRDESWDFEIWERNPPTGPVNGVQGVIPADPLPPPAVPADPNLAPAVVAPPEGVYSVYKMTDPHLAHNLYVRFSAAEEAAKIASLPPVHRPPVGYGIFHLWNAFTKVVEGWTPLPLTAVEQTGQYVCETKGIGRDKWRLNFRELSTQEVMELSKRPLPSPAGPGRPTQSPRRYGPAQDDPEVHQTVDYDEPEITPVEQTVDAPATTQADVTVAPPETTQADQTVATPYVAPMTTKDDHHPTSSAKKHSTHSTSTSSTSTSTKTTSFATPTHTLMNGIDRDCRNIDKLTKMKHDERHKCDHEIRKFEYEDNVAWVHETMHHRCRHGQGEFEFGVDYNCQLLLQDLPHEEQDAWMSGMLPKQCDKHYDGKVSHKDRQACKDLKQNFLNMFVGKAGVSVDKYGMPPNVDCGILAPGNHTCTIGVDHPMEIGCLGDYRALAAMDEKQRGRCDEQIGKLLPNETYQWTMTVLPQECQLWDPKTNTLEKKLSDECQENVQQFNDDEKEAWLIGIMESTTCPRHKKDRENLDKESKKKCDKIEKYLKHVLHM